MSESSSGPATVGSGDAGPREALRGAVEVARLAPSVHNTQPWRWRLTASEALELRADRTRQLAVADPDGLLLLESCGAALHHARLALLSAGWTARAQWMPDDADPDLLARLTVAGRTEADPAARQLLAAVPQRRTDRRPVADRRVPDPDLDALGTAVSTEDTSWFVLRPDEVVELTVAMADADRVESAEEEHRAEIEAWVGGQRPEATGIPDSVVPEQPPQTRVPGRYFGPPGTLPVDSGHDASARYAILHGDSDTSLDWLRAGEALSAAWLAATMRGLSLLPISAVVEVPRSRLALRGLLSGLGYPYLAVRLGYPETDTPPPPHTPRLPLEAILEDGTEPAGGGATR